MPQGSYEHGSASWMGRDNLMVIAVANVMLPYTEVTCPVIGWAQPELTPSQRQKTDPVHHNVNVYMY